MCQLKRAKSYVSDKSISFKGNKDSNSEVNCSHWHGEAARTILLGPASLYLCKVVVCFEYEET